MDKQLLFLDFESFWDTKNKYGLKQLSMVEYIRSPKFKAFGMGVAINDGKIEWISGLQIANFCSHIANTIGWPNIALVGHNVKFDGMILREIYECIPGQFICTKSMSRGVFGKTVKAHRLEAVAEHLGLPPKGTMRTDGLTELTLAQEKELAEYCLHDVELCREIYYKLSKEFPESQYEVMHRTVEMFICPKIQLNVALLEKTNEEEIKRRANIFEKIGISRSEFSSNIKFPALLQKFGYEVPTKISLRTGKTIPALALGDTEFISLMENGNEELKALCEARIAAKSNLLETRSAKLAAIGRTGYWPFDVEFSGADQTHRFSGGSGAGGNPQNFNRCQDDKAHKLGHACNGRLRESVEAPRGYNLVVGDFDKVECRMVAYLSRDPGLIAAIEGDAYSAFASNYYGRKITKADKAERRFGKEAILGLGYGMGWRKFKDRVKLKTGQDISEEEAKRGVGLYREMYNKVPALWELLDQSIPLLLSKTWIQQNNILSTAARLRSLPVQFEENAVVLPSGLKMRYPNLRQEKGERGKMEWVYDTWKKGHLEKSKLYGGKLLENISQSLAGELCKEAMLKFGNRVTGLVHDEIHVIAKKGTELVTKTALQRAMTVSPRWFPELRLKAEVGVGPNWAEAK